MYICSVFLDLTKAFYIVNHAIPLHKIEHNFGFRGISLQLFKSFLSNNRYQYTIFNYKFLQLKLSFGVSQGFYQGLLLFLLHINDLPQVSRFETTLLANDTILMLSDSSLNNSENKVKSELNKIEYWLKKQAIAKLY